MVKQHSMTYRPFAVVVEDHGPHPRTGKPDVSVKFEAESGARIWGPGNLETLGRLMADADAKIRIYRAQTLHFGSVDQRFLIKPERIVGKGESLQYECAVFCDKGKGLQQAFTYTHRQCETLVNLLGMGQAVYRRAEQGRSVEEFLREQGFRRKKDRDRDR